MNPVGRAKPPGRTGADTDAPIYASFSQGAGIVYVLRAFQQPMQNNVQQWIQKAAKNHYSR